MQSWYDRRGPLVGWIECRRTWRGIDESAWRELIRSLARLKSHPGLPRREGVNPFTKEPMTFARKPGGANEAIVVDGERIVGEMQLVREGPWEILVWGDRDALRPVACDVAARLGGRFLETP